MLLVPNSAGLDHSTTSLGHDEDTDSFSKNTKLADKECTSAVAAGEATRSIRPVAPSAVPPARGARTEVAAAARVSRAAWGACGGATASLRRRHVDGSTQLQRFDVLQQHLRSEWLKSFRSRTDTEQAHVSVTT